MPGIDTDIEVRSIPSGKLEIRKTADGSRKLVGYAAPFNSLSVPMGGFREKIAPGAFKRSLTSKPDVRLVADHDLSVSKILARTAAGTLSLREDDNGLGLEADLPNTTFADDVAESISRGDVDGLSISFIADDDDWQESSDGLIRTIRSASLGPEISLVLNPAYQQSRVSLRSCPGHLRYWLNGDAEHDHRELVAVLLAKRRTLI